MTVTRFRLNKTPLMALLLWAGTAAGQLPQQTLPVTALGEPLDVRVFLPPDYARNTDTRYPALYINDGQDAGAVGLAETLGRLYREKRIAPVIVVAVPMLPDRIGTYGFSDRAAGISLPAATRFGPVGARAHAYSQWLALELVPEIDRQFRTLRKSEARTVLGWSLGAASAFSIAWNYPEVFGRTGGFSPSFWLSREANRPDTAIAPDMIARAPAPTTFRAYFAVGTAEETDDRDGDGIIDAVDDVRGVYDALRMRFPGASEADLRWVVIEGGRHEQASWKRMLPDFLIWAFPAAAPAPQVSAGRIERLDFASAHIGARTVDIWLPPGYSDDRKYAVLYMQDGQMLFDAGITWNRQEWRADEVAAQLMAEGKVRPFIIVGVQNAGKARHSEYFPQQPFESLPEPVGQALLGTGGMGRESLFSEPIRSDAYLKFLVEELKPYIDRHYSVATAAADTAVMGSSMGGLVSLYAISEYPEVFGSAANLSTHWPGIAPGADNPVPDAFFAYMRENLPDPATHRIYFDYGTATLDAFYPPLQAKADTVMREKGYTEANWQTRRFDGAEHSEQAWAARLHIPLQFLFAPQ